MERTSQRYVPIVLIAVAALLLAARVASHFVEPAASKTSLIRWVTPEQGMALAEQSTRPVLLDFTAEWCAPCHVLDAEVFRDPDLARIINERFIAVRVVDRKREEGRNTALVDELQQRFTVSSFPTVLFVDGEGNVRGRMEGFQGKQEFERIMEQATEQVR
jgi:thiol:disulfide interchange protein